MFEAGVSLGEYTIETMPWHWTRAFFYYKKIKNIYAASAMDSDGLVAPKEYWFEEKALERWYKDRSDAK